jgi:hypothetical protein
MDGYLNHTSSELTADSSADLNIPWWTRKSAPFQQLPPPASGGDTALVGAFRLVRTAAGESWTLSRRGRIRCPKLALFIIEKPF